MLCVRCSHPLPPRADRCIRCFALNPSNSAGILSQPLRDSGPAAPVAMTIESDPPTAPLAISFDDEPLEIAPAVTEPEPAPVQTPKFAVPPQPKPEPARAPAPAPAPARPRARAQAPARARLLAWTIDALAITALTAACIALTLHKAHIRYPLDFLRDTAPLWAALIACISLAWSWLFIALASRTPGMAVAGHRLRSLYGGAPTPTEALARALLALPGAALGLSGFVLALFDARGQTLHDKLCRCIAVID